MTINKKTMIWKVEYYSSDEDRRIDKKSVGEFSSLEKAADFTTSQIGNHRGAVRLVHPEEPMFEIGEKVKIVDDYKEHHPRTGELTKSWRAGAQGTYQGAVDKRGSTVGVVLCGSEASGYFRFRVNPIYITNKL